MSEWNNYGFPDPTFYPAWKLAEGLVKALEEKTLIWAKTWDIDSIMNKTQYEIFSPESYYSSNFMARLDNTIDNIASNFVSEDGQNKLRLNDILLNVTGGDIGEIISSNATFSVEWYIKWAKQRKEAIDLLKYVIVPEYGGKYFEGYNVGGPGGSKVYPPTITDLNPGQLEEIRIQVFRDGNLLRKNIMGLTSYYARALSSAEGKPVNYTLYWIGRIYQNYNISLDVLNNISPFQPGTNVITAGSDGIFFDTPSYLSATVEMADKYYNEYDENPKILEFRKDYHRIVADYSQCFRFYDPPET